MIIIAGFVREPRPRARSIRSYVRRGMFIRNRLNHFTFMTVMICDSEKKVRSGEEWAENRYIEYIEMISRQPRIHHGVSKADRE